jgi:twitching motility two-component system response regulator PilG
MSNKTRVLNVRVVGFSAPERQMLNSIFLLSVAPARQIGYKLWNPETGVAPDMYLLDGDSESAVASWQATFASTSDRTLVVGSKNIDLGVASAARPLGLKVVGAMDRLAIALNNVARETAGHDVSAPSAGGTLPTAAESSPVAPKADLPKADQTLTRASSGTTMQQPSLSASMNAPVSPAASTMSTAAASTMSTAAASTLSTAAASTMSSAAATLSSNAQTMTASSAAAPVGVMPVSMTAAAPAATVLPNVTLQPNIPPALDKALEKSINDRSINEKPVPEKTVDRILSDKQPEKMASPAVSPVANLQASGVTPLSPSALSAAVAPSASRANLRVVPPPSPMAASLPAASATMAKLAEAPMQASMPAAAPLVSKLAEAPMQAPAPVQVAPTPVVAPPVPVMPVGTPTARHEEHNFRVLAVDDSPLMRTFLQNKLQPYGIQPEFAASGEEALFKISKQHFDLIFLDVMLPGMDGYDVCKMIKKNKDNALMKVVMLTSKDKTFDKIRGTMAGCDGYLTKPVDELKLRAIIERHSVSQK